MLDILAKIFSFAFVIIIYMFIIKIIQMVYSDMKVMSRKKSGNTKTSTYLKLINLRSKLDFQVQESYALDDDSQIGRSKKCSICIDDPFISQKHAEIILRDDVFYLNDLESTNGTFLNGEKVEGDPIELVNGDKIELGQLIFIFVTDVEKEGEDE